MEVNDLLLFIEESLLIFQAVNIDMRKFVIITISVPVFLVIFCSFFNCQCKLMKMSIS